MVLYLFFFCVCFKDEDSDDGSAGFSFPVMSPAESKILDEELLLDLIMDQNQEESTKPEGPVVVVTL